MENKAHMIMDQTKLNYIDLENIGKHPSEYIVDDDTVVSNRNKKVSAEFNFI